MLHAAERRLQHVSIGNANGLPQPNNVLLNLYLSRTDTVIRKSFSTSLKLNAVIHEEKTKNGEGLGRFCTELCAKQEG